MRQLLSVALVVCIAGAATLAVADQEKKPKYAIKQVMKTAMKGGLLKKVASGDASDEEKEKLHEMLKALAANKPPKGELDSWKAKTSALVKASKAGDGAALKKAANCGACHKAHKK